MQDILESFDPLSASEGISEKDRPSNYAIIRSAECVTSRHLLERTVGEVAKAIRWQGKVERCEDVGRLIVLLEKMLQGIRASADEEEEAVRPAKFTLVFDGIDKQRDASHMLVPALGRLSEIVGLLPSPQGCL